MRTRNLYLLSILGLTLACGGNGPQSESANNAAADPARVAVKEARERETISGADATQTDAEIRDFVVTIAAHGLAEVELGRIAAQRAANAEVKQFGQDIAND